MKQIPAAVLETPVTGLNLKSGTLREQLDGATLIVFLRHFG